MRNCLDFYYYFVPLLIKFNDMIIRNKPLMFFSLFVLKSGISCSDCQLNEAH